MERKKLLLIKLSSLGDVIFNIPLSYALKDAGYEVTWLVSEKGYDILKNNPCVDRVILAPIFKWRKRGFVLQNTIEFWNIIKTLRKEKFDISIDAQMMFKSLFFNMFCGAKRRITSTQAKEFSKLGANEFVEGISYSPKIPIVKNYLKFADWIKTGAETTNIIKKSLPERTQEQIAKVDELLKNIDKSKPTVIISPATTWDNKHWAETNWIKVAEAVSQSANIVFTGSEKDKKLIDKLCKNSYINLSGKTNLMELIEVFSRANVVVSPDSGSAHLAWALNKPAVITVFTCTPKDILAPYGDDRKYIALSGNLPCQPCFKKKCKKKDNINACQSLPTAEKVIEAIKKFI